MAKHKTLSVTRMTGPSVTETHLVCQDPKHMHTHECFIHLVLAPKDRVGVVVEYCGEQHYHEIESDDPTEIERQLADLAHLAETARMIEAKPRVILPSMGGFVTAAKGK